MSAPMRLFRASRPVVNAAQTARFSVAARTMKDGDTGAPRASADAFTKREAASESMYVHEKEKEKAEALRAKIQKGEAQLKQDKADMDALQQKK
ncbi:hypothetical protein AAFC00_001034 [Neodothiora populina]|uniref:ATPase inhibitor, mitochondrial n=1 Tax=Neodothiora populina TaxID=2781224 RepID=A0ABR3PMK9_9PEZI